MGKEEEGGLHGGGWPQIGGRSSDDNVYFTLPYSSTSQKATSLSVVPFSSLQVHAEGTVFMRKGDDNNRSIPYLCTFVGTCFVLGNQPHTV